MKTILKALFGLALLWFGFLLFTEARSLSQAPDADPTKIATMFAGVVLLGGTAAVLIVVGLIPYVGDAVGNFFYNPSEQVERSPHADALAAAARGDYESAVASYEEVLADDPHDTLALSEIARLYCEKLHTPEPAAAALEQALRNDLQPEEAAFLSSRLAEIYWKHQHDARPARELLLQIIEMLPDTKYSANALHQLQELERELSLEG